MANSDFPSRSDLFSESPHSSQKVPSDDIFPSDGKVQEPLSFRSAQPSSGNKIWVVLTLGAILLGLCGAGLILFQHLTELPPGLPALETVPYSDDDLKAAFTIDLPFSVENGTAADVAEIRTFLQELNAPDQQHLLKTRFDLGRMTRILRQDPLINWRFAASNVTRLTVESEEVILQKKLLSTLSTHELFTTPGELTLRKLRFNADRTLAVAYVLSPVDATEAPGHFRWCLCKTGGRWMLYDFEGLFDGSAYLATLQESLSQSYSVLRQGQHQLEPHLQAVKQSRQSLEDALLAIEQGDPKQVLAKLNTVEVNRLTRNNQIHYYGALARVHMLDNRPQDAIGVLQNCPLLQQNIPLLEFARAHAFFELGEYDQALQVLRSMLNRMGDHAGVHILAARALHRQGNDELAFGHVQRALAEHPLFDDVWTNLAQTLTPSHAPPFLEFLRNSPHRLSIFQHLTREGGYWTNRNLLKLLLPVMREEHPDALLTRNVDAFLLFQKREFAEAASVLRPALADLADVPELDELQERSLRLFCEAAVASNQVLAAYDAIPNPRRAFRALAENVNHESLKSRDQLRELVHKHQQLDPQDPELSFQQGLLASDVHCSDEAADHLWQAWSTAADDDSRARYSWSTGWTLSQTRDWSRRFSDGKMPADIFQALANRFVNDKHWDDLQELLRLRRLSGEPPTREERYFQVQLHLERKKLEYALKEIEQVLAELKTENLADWEKSRWLNLRVKAHYRFQPVDEVYQWISTQAAKDHIQGRIQWMPLAIKEIPAQIEADFLRLCDLLIEDQDHEVLDRLVKTYLKEHKDGVDLHLRLARRAEKQKDWDAALAEYRQVVALDQDQKHSYLSKYSIPAVMVKAGRIAEAYQTYVAATPEQFSSLAHPLNAAERVDSLETLVCLHETSHPDASGLAYWRARVCYLREDYAGAEQLLRAPPPSGLSSPFDGTSSKELLWQCLLRQNLGDEALELARELDGDPSSGQVWHQLVTHALRNDLAATLDALEQYVTSEDSSLFEVYEDELLGPRLRSPPFHLVRQRFPEPDTTP